MMMPKLIKQLFVPSIGAKLSDAFVCDEFGFTLTIESQIIKIQWADIDTVFGYKIDCLTYDEICLDVFTDKGSMITITESAPGWNQFNERLIGNIFNIPSDWIYNIANPAFTTNMTLLFDKQGRTKDQAEADLYK